MDKSLVTFTIDLGDGTGAQSVIPSSPIGPITVGQIVGSTSAQQPGMTNTLTVTFANPPILPQRAGSFEVIFAASAAEAIPADNSYFDFVNDQAQAFFVHTAIKATREWGDRDKAACLSDVLRSIEDLRDKVERELNDSTATISPLQLTKPEVLSTIDFVLMHTIPNRTVRARTHAFHICLVPEELLKNISITAVIQEAHGLVEILKHGDVLYTPGSKTRAADTFTATLTDAEGATVTKTLTLVLPKNCEYNDDEKHEIFESIQKIMDHRSGDDRR